MLFQQLHWLCTTGNSTVSASL